MPFYTNDGLAPKRVLAWNFKRMVACSSFEQVTISDLCEQSNLDSKDFTCYFKNKYDLARWLYDSEFFHYVLLKQYNSELSFFRDLSRYLELEQEYYRVILNSKIDVMQAYIAESIEYVLRNFRGAEEARALAPRCIYVMKQELLEKHCKTDVIYERVYEILTKNTVVE